jgi:regulator of protease activity HflC (stomatin/prohibitin superfamily)
MNVQYLLSLLLAIAIVGVQSFWVTVPTGFVGVPVVFGKVVAPLLMPGLSYYNPISTRIEVVEVRPQSDAVHDIECITNEGLKLSFERIEIGNMLATESVISTVEKFGPLYDRFLVLDLVRHQVNVICAQKTFHQIAISEFEQLDDELRGFIQAENDRQNSGLTIMFVRLTKPKLPASIEKNYLSLAEEKTRKQVIDEMKVRVTAEKESEMIVAAKDNEIKEQKADAENKMMIQKMRAQQQEQVIKNEMVVAEAKAQAQRVSLEAEAMSAMYKIPRYAEVKIAEFMSQNQKIYFGDKIPKYVVTSSNSDMQT